MANAVSNPGDFERSVSRQEEDPHVITGYVRRGHKGRREQKGVDVRLAVDDLDAAAAQRVKAIGRLAGDADFAPLATAIGRAGPHVIVLAFPGPLSSELRGAADRVILLSDPPPDWSLR